MKLFGFEIKRDIPSYLKDDPVKKDAISIVDRDTESTAAIVATATSSMGLFIDVQGTIKTEAELITNYRDMMGQAEVDNAVDEIINEAITTEDDYIVKIDLDETLLPDNIKQVLEEKHKEVEVLLDFQQKCYHIFKRFYVDGRLYYHLVVDTKHLEEGIKELRYVDPRKLREIKEVEQKKIAGQDQYNQPTEITVTKNNYYLYNDKGFSQTARAQTGMYGGISSGIKISKDSIVHVPSGLTDTNGSIGLSYLHKGLRPLRQLKSMEDGLIIYRLARAPERRVWYVDIGNLPRIKADQYVQNVMTMNKNKLIYDSATGQIQDSRKFMTMLEDYWLPRRSDGTGTRVETLAGGDNLGKIEDIQYFQKLLYNSLNVPIERLQADTPFTIGNNMEITRSEIKFNKFINRLQNQFSLLFKEILKKQVVLQGLMTIEEFETFEKKIKYEFARDNHWDELKDQQIMTARVTTYMGLAQNQLIGKYFSNRYIQKNIFKQTDEEIEKMTEEIIEETQNPLYQQMSPEAEQDQMAGNQEQDQQSQEGDPEQQSNDPGEDDNKQQQLDRAAGIVDAIKQIPPDKRTPGDHTKLRSTAQSLAKAGISTKK